MSELLPTGKLPYVLSIPISHSKHAFIVDIYTLNHAPNPNFSSISVLSAQLLDAYLDLKLQSISVPASQIPRFSS